MKTRRKRRARQGGALQQQLLSSWPKLETKQKLFLVELAEDLASAAQRRKDAHAATIATPATLSAEVH